MNSWFLQKLLQDFCASNLISCSRNGNDILMIMANETIIFTLLAASFFFFNELLMQAFFPPVDTHQHFPNPLWTITLSCQLASGLAAGLINFNISSKTICVKKFCFNAITKNPAASSVTHHFTHVQIYCRIHYQMCAMDGGLTASILSAFLLLFLQRLESEQISCLPCS